MKERINVKRITITALFTAVIFVTTAFVKFPIALGYFHVGDAFILLGSFILPPFYSVIASIIGSVLADVMAGYFIYAPATLIAKGIMAMVASLFFYKKTTVLRFLLGAIISSLIMVLVYFIFEGIFYGWGLAVSNLPMQFVQPGIALVLSGAIILSLGKVGYIIKIKGDISTKNAKQVPQNAKNGD